MNPKLEKYRQSFALWKSNPGDNFGLFYIPVKSHKACLKVMSSPLGEGDWDHVSVSLPDRCPTWNEMCFIKDLFWDDSETVIQFHPKKSAYVNVCKTCLHLWKSNKSEHELPPKGLIG